MFSPGEPTHRAASWARERDRRAELVAGFGGPGDATVLAEPLGRACPGRWASRRSRRPGRGPLLTRVTDREVVADVVVHVPGREGRAEVVVLLTGALHVSCGICSDPLRRSRPPSRRPPSRCRRPWRSRCPRRVHRRRVLDGVVVDVETRIRAAVRSGGHAGRQRDDAGSCQARAALVIDSARTRMVSTPPARQVDILHKSSPNFTRTARATDTGRSTDPGSSNGAV